MNVWVGFVAPQLTPNMTQRRTLHQMMRNQEEFSKVIITISTATYHNVHIRLPKGLFLVKISCYVYPTLAVYSAFFFCNTTCIIFYTSPVCIFYTDIYIYIHILAKAAHLQRTSCGAVENESLYTFSVKPKWQMVIFWFFIVRSSAEAYLCMSPPSRTLYGRGSKVLWRFHGDLVSYK